LPESKACLDSIQKIFDSLQYCIFEIAVHTDSRGTPEFNDDISQRRADQLMRYFIYYESADSGRLIPKGYGESAPVLLRQDLMLPDSTIVPKGIMLTENFISSYKEPDMEVYEFLHRQNRRIEFKITGFTEPYNSIKDCMSFCNIDFSHPGTGQYFIPGHLYHFLFESLSGEPDQCMDSIINCINRMSDVVFEIATFTDSRNTAEYNLTLSSRLAQQQRNTFIERGADSTRLTAKGYGESSPRILEHDIELPDGTIVPKGTELTEEFILRYKADQSNFEVLHQLNRRLEIRVVAVRD